MGDAKGEEKPGMLCVMGRGERSALFSKDKSFL